MTESTMRVAVAPPPSPRPAGSTPGMGAVTPVPRAQTPQVDLDARHPAIGFSLNEIRAEVDEAYKDCRAFPNREPDGAIRSIQGHFARMGEIRMRISRMEAHAPAWKVLRTQEVEPLMKELGLQYEMASRRHTIRMDEYKIETGER